MKKLVRLLFCSLPLIIVTACGGGGGSSSTAADPSTPPSVLSVVPLDGTAGVSATSTVIKVVFTDAMDPTSVVATPKSAGPLPASVLTPGTFRVSYETPTYTYVNAFHNMTTINNQRFIVDGTLTADATNKVFTFTPTSPLTALDGVLNLPLNSTGDPSAARNFTINIKGGPNGVRKADGTHMSLDFNSSFTIWAGTQQIPSSSLYNDVANGVGTDGDGNVYLAGYTYGSQFLDSTITKTTNTAGILLAKYDPNGVWQWNALLGSQFNDQIKGFTIDNTSISGTAQLVSVGFTDGTLNYLVNSNLVNPDATGNTHNYFVAKYIEGGSQPWTVTQSGTAVSCIANAVATDINGNIYVAGETFGDLPTPGGPTTTTYQGPGSNIFVAKYDTKLNLVWTKVFGKVVNPNFTFTGNASATGIAVDTNSSDPNHPNVYITGWFDGNLFGLTNQGAREAFVAKLDNTGGLMTGSSNFSPTPIGTAGGDTHANAIAVDGRGYVTVVGGTSGTLYAPILGVSDFFVVAFDNLGNIRFQRQIGTTSSNDQAFGVTTDALYDVYVTGSTFGNLFGINQGGGDSFVVKFNNHSGPNFGATVWSNQLGSSQLDVGTAVAYFTGPNGTLQNPTGYLFVAGYTYGDLDTNFNLSGGRSSGIYSTSDVFLTKYSSTTGLKY